MRHMSTSTWPIPSRDPHLSREQRFEHGWLSVELSTVCRHRSSWEILKSGMFDRLGTQQMEPMPRFMQHVEALLTQLKALPSEAGYPRPAGKYLQLSQKSALTKNPPGPSSTSMLRADPWRHGGQSQSLGLAWESESSL